MCGGQPIFAERVAGEQTAGRQRKHRGDAAICRESTAVAFTALWGGVTCDAPMARAREFVHGVRARCEGWMKRKSIDGISGVCVRWMCCAWAVCTGTAASRGNGVFFPHVLMWIARLPHMCICWLTRVFPHYLPHGLRPDPRRRVEAALPSVRTAVEARNIGPATVRE